MGIVGSFLGRTGRTDDPDEVTGLTSREKYLVQTSWVPLRKDLTKSGVVVLTRLFEKYPEEQNHFPFKNVPLCELGNDKKFQAHCSDVMYSVTSIVDSMGDSELLVNILEKIGKRHKRHKVAPKSFENLKEVMLALFKEMMSKNTVEAWTKTLNVAFSVIEKEL